MVQKMKWVAIKDGDLFLQGVEANANYQPTGRAIQSSLHSYSEFSPVWGESENWMDERTAGGYLNVLLEYQRWNHDDKLHEYKIVCMER